MFERVWKVSHIVYFLVSFLDFALITATATAILNNWVLKV